MARRPRPTPTILPPSISARCPTTGCTPRSARPRADPIDIALASEVQTASQGTTLRGLLLDGYALWEMGQTALIAAISSFVLGGVMPIPGGLGLWHLRRVNSAEELFGGDASAATPTPVPA